MYLDIGKISIHISPAFAVFLAFTANTLEGRIYLFTFLCVFMHELTHILFLFLFGCERARMDFYPGGIRLNSDGFSSLSYEKTVICTLSAPLMNLILAAVLFTLSRFFPWDFFEEGSLINLIMGAANLLPMPFLDGGRALEAILYKYSDIEKASKICNICSIISLLFILLLFFISLIRKEYYLVLLFFFIYCTIGNINHNLANEVC